MWWPHNLYFYYVLQSHWNDSSCWHSIYIIMWLIVSHFLLFKATLIHISGLLKKRHVSLIAYKFCRAISFTLKFSGIKIEHVLQMNRKFHWIQLPTSKMVSRKQVVKKTFTLFYQGSKIFTLSQTPGNKCCTCFNHEASILLW